MNWKLIITLNAILLLTAGAWLIARSGERASTLTSGGTELLVTDFDVARVRSIRLVKGSDSVEIKLVPAEEAEAQPAGKWVVSSSFGYQARKSKIDDLFKDVRELKKGELRAENPSTFTQFELGEDKETLVEFLGETGNRILAVRFGKVNYSMAGVFNPRAAGEDQSTTFVRLNDDKQVFEVPGSHTLMTKAGDWLDLEIMKEDFDKIDGLRLEGEHGEITIVRKEKPLKEGETDSSGGKPEYEWFMVKTIAGRGEVLVKAKKWAAESLVKSVANLSGGNVAAPMEIGAEEADVSEENKKKYGFDKPALTVQILTGKEEVKTLHFGVVEKKEPAGPGLDPEGDDQDKDKQTYYVYYPQKRSQFDLAMSDLGLGGQKIKSQKVHVYVLEKYTYDGINKKPRDLKEEAEEAKDAFVRGVEWEDVAGFVISRGSEKVSVRKRISEIALAAYGTEIWASEDHFGCPVATEKVEAFIKELRDLKLGDQAVPGISVSETGLDDASSVRVTLIGAEAKELASFTIGAVKKADSKEFTYMAAPGQDPREVPGQHAFSPDPAAWLDLAVFSFEPAELMAFAVVTPEHGDVTLERRRDVNGKTAWLVRKRVIGRREFEYVEADSGITENIVTLMSRLTARGIEKPVAIFPGSSEVDAAQLVPFGLDKPCLILAGILSDRQQIVVHIGKSAGIDDYYGYVPVQRQVTPWGGGGEKMLVRVWKLNKFVVEALIKGEDHFKKKTGDQAGPPGEKPGEGEKIPGEGEKPPGDGEKPPGEPGSGEKPPGEKPGDGSGKD